MKLVLQSEAGAGNAVGDATRLARRIFPRPDVVRPVNVNLKPWSDADAQKVLRNLALHRAPRRRSRHLILIAQLEDCGMRCDRTRAEADRRAIGGGEQPPRTAAWIGGRR